MLIKLEVQENLAKDWNVRIDDIISESSEETEFNESLEKMRIGENDIKTFFKGVIDFDELNFNKYGFYICQLNGFASDVESLTECKIVKTFDSFKDSEDYKSNYGVCDNPNQILKMYPELEDSFNKKFVVSMTPIWRENQPENGGWRWHKWGRYIGDFEPQREYLYDEEGIDRVFVYRIYEVESKEMR